MSATHPVGSGFGRFVRGHADAVVTTPLRIVLVVVLALVIRQFAHRAINRLTSSSAEGRPPRVLAPLRERILSAPLLENSLLVSQRRRQRADTVGSLLKSIVSTVIFVVTFLIVLGELGIELAPLLAGTSIVGVALGFGAQSIVKDFLAGLFLILEDQCGVGDVVDVKEATGVVEAVGLRTTRLRDEYGTVWYVRNGEIVRVGNQSQGYAQVVLDVPVASGVPVLGAADVVALAARELHDDPVWAPDFLGEPELQGVQELTRDQCTVRVAVRVRPAAQWRIARELRQRIRIGLDDAVAAADVSSVGAQGGSNASGAPTGSAPDQDES